MSDDYDSDHFFDAYDDEDSDHTSPYYHERGDGFGENGSVYDNDKCYHCTGLCRGVVKSQGCMGEMPEEDLSTFPLYPEDRSLDNISHFDVYWIVKKVINVLEVMGVDPKNIQEKAIKLDIEVYMKLWQKSLKDQKMIDMGKKIEGQVKITLEMKLKKLLKLPEVAVIKILDFLLDQAFSDNDVEMVKFEERDDNDKVS